MFQNEGSNDIQLSVELLMSDGRRMFGKVTIPYGSQLIKQLNGSNRFIEFEDADGTPKFVSKDSVVELTETKAKKPPKLDASKAMESDNPYVVLGIPVDAGHEAIRAAYARLAKQYHPDQFNAVRLPPEVASYMTRMFEQISTAYQMLARRDMPDAAA
ncbi:MAG TPA: J domain-containing protein [Hyphomicrobiaceae bacterium]|nr:J domain-containing protein [Hyphomicrobiaceae bacterium]